MKGLGVAGRQASFGASVCEFLLASCMHTVLYEPSMVQIAKHPGAFGALGSSGTGRTAPILPAPCCMASHIITAVWRPCARPCAIQPCSAPCSRNAGRATCAPRCKCGPGTALRGPGPAGMHPVARNAPGHDGKTESPVDDHARRWPPRTHARMRTRAHPPPTPHHHARTQRDRETERHRETQRDRRRRRQRAPRGDTVTTRAALALAQSTSPTQR